MIGKRFLMASSIMLLVVLLTGSAQGQGLDPISDTNLNGQEFAPDQLLVRFHPWTNAQRADQLLADRGLSRVRQIHALGVHVLRLPPGLSVERAVEIFGNLPEVEFAEPNYILRILAPSRVEIEDQWGLNNIQAPEAWDQIPEGSRSPVLLAIVDTGIDRNHSDLAQNIWQNPGEIEGNGVDDEGNGYVDDSWGWDFVNNDNAPFDDHMHGTACSSVAAGAQDGSGVAGVCPWCTLIAVKVIDASGSGYLDTVATGITYATDEGAKVINLSLGGIIGSQTLENAVNYAWDRDALVVAAAGNDGADSRLYPAAYANAMAIASTNRDDYRSCFSNYGAGYIAVAAPGESILCATPNQSYGTYDGTSLSTPHVSGLGGLLFSQDPDRINADVRAIIETTVNDLGPSGPDAYFGSGRINAHRAVTNDTAPTDPPPGLFSDDVTASGYAHARKLARDADGTLHLVWHGRDGGQYRVLYATSSDGGASWSTPEVVFSSSAETYHPALAIDGQKVYIAFPSKQDASNYRIFFTSKPLASGSWSTPIALMGGTYHAVRPDLYYDASSKELHLVASSYDDAPYVYYASSVDGGANWSTVHQINVGYLSRYADVHANGSKVYIAGRTMEMVWLLPPIIGYPRYRLFSIRSLNSGETWQDLKELAVYDGWLTGEYGASLAGVGDRLYLAYEHIGAIYFRRSEDGAVWSAETNAGSGAWPSVTQAVDGQAWLMWDSAGTLSLRHYTGSGWDSVESVGTGNYPNFKPGTAGGLVEWTASHCSGAPFRLIYDSRALAANNPPVASAGGPYSGAEDVAIQFDGSGSSDPDGDPLSYNWDFGDGTSGTGVSPTHAYPYGGNFTVMLTVTDGKDGMGTDSTTATVSEVNDPPVADPDGPYSGTVGDPISFDGSGSYDPDNQDGITANDQSLNYEWDFGDESTTGTGATPTHTYDAAGYYTVTLVVSDGVGLSVPATTTASVVAPNSPPVANDVTASGDEDTVIAWTPSVNDPDGGEILTCSIASQPSSGTASVNSDCSSGTYTPYGDFFGTDTFVYEVCDTGPLCDTGTVAVTVDSVNDPPAAKAGGLYAGTEDISLAFNGSGSSDPDGDELSYNWDFGDGNTGTGISPSHAYEYGGTFTVILTVTDGKGSMDTDTTTATVQEVNDIPVADPNGPYSGTVGDPITFDGSGSYDPDNQDGTTANDQSLTCEWDFGDESTGTGATPTHTYDGAGDYTVTLVVSDGVALSAPATTTASVVAPNSPPVAVNDVAATLEDTAVTIDVLENDTDADGDALSVESVTQPAHGLAASNLGLTITYTPTADFLGTDSFVYEVCDIGSLCDTATVTVTVTPVSMHVGDLEGSSTSVRNKWMATVTIMVHYADHSPVAGARVSGLWSEGPSETGWCDTGSDGQCSIELGGIAKNIPSVIFTVKDVISGTLAYQSGDNHDPDGDSDGTSITVSAKDTNLPPEATFTYLCTGLTCDFNASGSSDPDGTIASYDWAFGDDNTASGITVTHTYLNSGTYPVTLTVTDARGATDTDTQFVTVGGAAGTIHIYDFTLSGKAAGPNRSATAVITIQDVDGNPVSGATVSGSWSGDYIANVSGVTGADGTVTFTSGRMRQDTATFTFTVDDVSKSGYIYDGATPSLKIDVP